MYGISRSQMQTVEEEYKWVRCAFGYGVRRHESEIERSNWKRTFK